VHWLDPEWDKPIGHKLMSGANQALTEAAHVGVIPNDAGEFLRPGALALVERGGGGGREGGKDSDHASQVLAGILDRVCDDGGRVVLREQVAKYLGSLAGLNQSHLPHPSVPIHIFPLDTVATSNDLID
jgi:hypothetical protein